jgi:hypothetical protein
MKRFHCSRLESHHPAVMSNNLSADLAMVSERYSNALQQYRKAICDIQELQETQASNLREHIDFVGETARKLTVCF